MRTMLSLSMVFLFFASSPNVAQLSEALDTITVNRSIQHGESLVSAGGMFELGFFSTGIPSRQYLGIWYKKVTTMKVVWVANRITPLVDSSGSLKVTGWGSLVLLNANGSEVWSSNSYTNARNPVAQLLDSGNLVIKDVDGAGSSILLWQSFDYPTDTLLAGMKMGRNRMTGFERYLTSWKSTDDPSPGNFTYKIDPNGFPETLLRQGTVVKFRTGPWNGVRYSGVPNLDPNPYYSYEFVLDDDEIYYRYELLDSSFISKLVLSSNGVVQRLTWIDRTQSWTPYLTVPIDNCDTYALCGAYGICKIYESPPCECLLGFKPNYSQEGDNLDWSSGCVRATPVDCWNDTFVMHSGVKLPDTSNSWFNKSMNLQECKEVCNKNCSCMAYSNVDIRGGGSGCLLWFEELIDIRELNKNGQDLYIRMAASESDLLQTKQKKQKLFRGLAVSFGVFTPCLVLICCILHNKRRKLKHHKGKDDSFESGENSKCLREDLELPVFDLGTVAIATNNFSEENKLGEGGFGPVYKGVLEDGQEIAVKKLSRDSRQGLHEFKNEVLYISKLQHRNLVKLLGCCIQQEVLLIYEFMPNNSLESCLFDQNQRKRLDWSNRFHIINGIARGLLYLHQDSRLRIIHRDLKAGNILLDNEMNPKISDFGSAKSFTGNETQANTIRVVGTYGYMSPEYAIDGVFSMKSDVFSYGVLVLETVSGKKNRGFHHTDHCHNLVGHAWKLFTEDRFLELLDEFVQLYNTAEVLRSIHVALLCVQQCPEDRPSMSAVILMLGSDNELPLPKEPGFYNERKLLPEHTSSHLVHSSNEVSMTVLSPR